MNKKIKDSLAFLKNTIDKLKLYFLKKDGEKNVLNLKRAFAFGGPIFGLSVLTVYIMSSSEDSSFLGKSDKKLVNEGQIQASASSGIRFSNEVAKVIGSSQKDNAKKKPVNQRRDFKINFKAQQVISRDGTGDPTRNMPMGTNLIGKTLTAIDTREANQIVKILLPYGGRSKMGVEIEKGTVLFGQAAYSGRGRKVSIAINKGLTPDEREFSIEAQVLDPSNYSTGLVAESNSQSDLRVMSALGLSVAAGAADIMIEREAANGFGQSAPRPTLGNAALKGISGSAQEEATKKADAYKDLEDYLTLPAGSDVIVSLTKSLTVD